MTEIDSEQVCKPEVPCYRCLFEQPFCSGWCDPNTCEMLENWLKDDDFDWKKYALGWILNMEIKHNTNSTI